MQRIGIIGGSGFGDAFAGGTTETVQTEWGLASVSRSTLEGGPEIIFVARHGAGHKLPPHLINHRANIAALQAAGAEGVLATAAVGSLRPQMAPGHYVILDDLIDFTRGEVQTFTGPGNVKHTDMGQPFDAKLREALREMSREITHADVHETGTYVCLSGPRYETRTEIKMLAAWGGDLVGMTIAPEAILCAEVQMPYAGISIVTNFGCGLLTEASLSHTEVEAQMAESRQGLIDWLTRTAHYLSKQ